MMYPESGLKDLFKKINVTRMKIYKNSIRLIKIFLKKFIHFDSNLTKDIFFIIRKLNLQKPIFVDVGAYKGFWINRYLRKFPNSYAYLLEPHKPSYQELKRKFNKYKNIKVSRIALSNKNGIKEVNVNNKSYTNSLLQLDPEVLKHWKDENLEHLYREKVTTLKLDDFFLKNKIKKINILKLDVQGHESKVLEGSKALLKDGLIDILVLEVIIAPTYKNQSKVSKIFEVLDEFEYGLYGVYDIQKSKKREKIQQFDAIFYKKSLPL